jgi:hypothetical protein
MSQRLRAQAFEAAGLRMRIEEEAAAVLGLLASEGIPVILIKGVARCALAQRYPYLDARATRDVDLLLPQGTIQAAHDLLQTRGYVPTRMREEGEPEHHHLQALRNERNVAVELHESNSVRVPAEVAWARATERSEELEWAGLRVRVPCPTEIVWSAIAHGLADGIRGFRLERFLEVAALVSGAAPVDWPTIRERSESREACHPSTPAGAEAALPLGWLNAALVFVDSPLRPAALAGPGIDLTGLMEWRLLVLRARQRLGRAFTERLMEEGPRILLGLPIRESPPDTSWPGRLRRRTAGRASRVLFRAWRAYTLTVVNDRPISHSAS